MVNYEKWMLDCWCVVMGHHLSKKAAWFEIASHLQILVLHTIFTFGTNKYCLHILTIHCLTINNKTLDSCSTNVKDEHNGFRESIDFHQDEGNLWEMSELRRDRPESDIRSRNWTSFLQGDNHCFQKSDFHWKIKVSLFFFCQLSIWFLYFLTTNSNAVHSSHRQWWIQQFGGKWKWTWKNLATSCSKFPRNI